MRKRAEWEKTWDLQRKEGAGEKVGPIPVPPKYFPRRLVAEERITFVHVGRHVRIPRSALEEFIHQGTVEASRTAS